MTDAELRELTETRFDKEHLIEFAFQFLVDHQPIGAIQSRFNIAVISTYFPEFPAAVKQWVAENTQWCINDINMAGARENISPPSAFCVSYDTR